MKKAIALLTRGYKTNDEYASLIQRNKSIEENINNIRDYDFIVFHENNITIEQQIYIQDQTSLDLQFWGIPKFEPRNHEVFKPTAPWGWNYRHMCNFWFSEFLDRLGAYDQLLRIDEDCTVYSNLDQIFDALNEKVCVYGMWCGDDWFNVHGLDEFCKGIFPNKPRKEIGGPYTNLVAWDLKRIRANETVKGFIKAVNESEAIYTHRWGDHMLWGEALYYGFDESEYCELKSVSYYHASCLTEVNCEKEQETEIEIDIEITPEEERSEYKLDSGQEYLEEEE